MGDEGSERGCTREKELKVISSVFQEHPSEDGRELAWKGNPDGQPPHQSQVGTWGGVMGQWESEGQGLRALGRVRTWKDERTPLLRQAPASGVSDVARKGGDIRTSVWGVIG